MPLVLSLLIAIAVGTAIGLSLGALGSGGSILAVPALIYLLDQDPGAAATGSLVVVGASAGLAAALAWRSGRALLGYGAAFGASGVGGAVLGSWLARGLDDDLLLLGFAGILLVVTVLMATGRSAPEHAWQSREPIIQLAPDFRCDCPLLVKLLVTATAVGTLTGVFGVGGGFLAVPALVLVFSLPVDLAVGTSLVSITVTSGAALAARAGSGLTPDWTVVGVITVAALAASVLGRRVADRVDRKRLTRGFVVLTTSISLLMGSTAVAGMIG